MRHQISLGHGRDGWSLLIRDCPLYKEFAGRSWAWLCDLTGGRLGGYGGGSIMWKIPIGRAKWDYTTFGEDDPILINSVGSKLYDIWNAIMNWGDGRNVVWISIDRDTAYKIDPEWVTEVEDRDREDEEDAA